MCVECNLKSNDNLVKVKKQEKIEKDRQAKEAIRKRDQEAQNMMENLDNYYNTQVEVLKSQMKVKTLNRDMIE